MGNKSWEVEASKLSYIKERIWELGKLRVVRNIECIKNCKIANFWSQTLIFQIRNFSKSLNFPIWTIPETSNLENSKNFQFGKFKKKIYLENSEICNLANKKIVNLGNSKKFQFGKLKKNSIMKIRKICNLANFKNFPHIPISKNIKFFKLVNFEK